MIRAFVLFSFFIGLGVTNAGPDFQGLPKDSALVVQGFGNDVGNTQADVAVVRGHAIDVLLQQLPSMQKEDGRLGQVTTIINSEVGVEKLPAIGEKNSSLYGSTYVFLAEKSHEEMKEDRAHELSLLFTRIRSAATGTMYFLHFSDINNLQATALATMVSKINAFWAPPKKWNKFQEFFQNLFGKVKYARNVMDWTVEKGIPKSLYEMTGRLLVNVVHGSLISLASIAIIKLQNPLFLYDDPNFKTTVFYGIIPNALADEAANKWANVEGHELLTRKQYVTITTLRQLTFAILLPMVQNGSSGAEITTGIIGAAGLIGFFQGPRIHRLATHVIEKAQPVWIPIQDLFRPKVDKFVENLHSLDEKFQDFHSALFIERRRLTTLNLSCSGIL